MESVIPIEVREFVTKYVDSLVQLEVLLLVSALPDREWSVNDVDNVIRSTLAVVTERLELLVAEGILVRNGEPSMYRYQPRTMELAHAVSALSATYKLSRHKIVELIYATERSDDTLKNFTEAFRFKRKD